MSAGTTTTKEKVPTKKLAATLPQNQPSSSNIPSTPKTLVVSDSMDYNIVDDMKKTKANITMFELSKLKHQQKLLLKELNALPSSLLPSAQVANDSGQPPSGRIEATDTILIGDRSNSHTPPFLLTYEIYNRNLYNYLIDSGASSNIMPTSVCSKLNIKPQKSVIHIVQLDRTKVQVLGEINSVTISHLKHYQSLVQELISQFLAFNISPIPRSQNATADFLANSASKLLPSEDYSPDRFSVELIFRPSVPDNITNWRVFNHDEDILNFLTSDKSYDDQIIDESDHDLEMKEKQEENSIPKPVVKLGDLYDIKDRFKEVTNSKLQSSTLRFELINLGTQQNPQNINLGLGLSVGERKTFIRLLRKNKHVIAWKYDDLKTYDTSIIQHTIPMLSEQKPVQQKLRKIHPNLESQIKSELNKLLKAKIIFPVRHSNWVSNMVPIRKKNGDIRICIDFKNLNKASQKDNFPLPTMEQILHSIVGSDLMSFLDGFSRYNQILVHPDDRLKTTFRTKWGTYAY
eukprot:PITA_26383